MYNPRISYQGQRALYNGNHEVRDLDNISILYYGSPYTETLTIYYPKNLIENSIIVDEIWFVVGGKKSPLIQSQYEIKLSKKSFTNANLCIQKIKENITLIDEIEGKNSNKIKMLKDVLNR